MNHKSFCSSLQLRDLTKKWKYILLPFGCEVFYELYEEDK